MKVEEELEKSKRAHQKYRDYLFKNYKQPERPHLFF